MAIRIISDSTSYITPETKEKLDIKLISLGVNFPNESFLESNLENEFFYNKIINEDIIPSSSQPPQGEFFKVFKDAVSVGDDVLGIFISSELSGTYQNALSAKNMVLQEYPEANIEIIDSRATCMALGLIVVEAAKAAQNGQSLSEIIKLANELVEKVFFYFVPLDLTFLKKGGRIGGAASLIASILNIKPVLHLTEGRIDVYKKARGMRSAVSSIIEVMEEDLKVYGIKHILVHHVNDYEKGVQLAKMLPEHLASRVEIVDVGPVIGLHVGPGSVGIVYCRK